MKTATQIETMKGWKGDARRYRLSEPLDGYTEVFVSAAVVPLSGPETYIFGVKEGGGEPDTWMELTGSFKGALDHRQALERAGYTVEEPCS